MADRLPKADGMSPARRTRRKLATAKLDPVESARAIGLRYVRETTKGIHRETTKSGFRYLDVNGSNLDDADHLERIRLLVIPPAWKRV